MMKRLWTLGAVVALGTGLTAGCGQDDAAAPVVELGGAEQNPLASGDTFVAIPKGASAEQSATRTGLRGISVTAQALNKESESFYLAIKKSALDKQWFYSGFLKSSTDAQTLYTGGIGSLGTDVVGMRVQNGKLFIYRTEKGLTWSDQLNPDIIVDAYPIVAQSAFDRLLGAGDYLLVDPSQGLNNVVFTYSLNGRDWGQTAQQRLNVDLAYLQNYLKLDDGVSFDEVITGTVNSVFDGTTPTAAMTTNISLREYKEGAGFTTVTPPDEEYYFYAPHHVVKDQAAVVGDTVIKWNIKKGMKPIEWLITPNAVDLGTKYGVPLVDTIKQGVEAWNGVFGFKALSARLATASELGRDDRNYIFVDSNVAAGFAYADPRVNPNTGEVRGAIVYFPAAFFAGNSFTDDAAASASQMRVSHFNGLTPSQPVCALSAQEPSSPKLPSDTTKATKGEKLIRYLTMTITHEVGHTLGLRHNFKGSLVPPSSTVMDYLRGADDIAQAGPGTYDQAAIKYLYGLSTDLPTDPFCNDDSLSTDPDCMVFDTSADPLNKYFGFYWSYFSNLALSSGDFADYESIFDFAGPKVMSYLRAGTAEQSATAWSVLSTGLTAPLSAEQLANPGTAATADQLMLWVWQHIYSPDESIRIGVTWASYGMPLNDPTDPDVVAAMTEQLSLQLQNVDGVRSFETRRFAVDVLKSLQSTAAYEGLLAAQTELNDALTQGTVTGDEAALSKDLLARINVAVTPYFN
jgi:hypothetical protein